MINRTIYIGDIHSSSVLKSFIKKYDDGQTMFISLGDLFDRGPSSYENYLILSDLYRKGKFKMVLGNHDFFFLVGIGFSEEYEGFLLKSVKDSIRYKDYLELGKNAIGYLEYNGGSETLDSILERYSGIYGQSKSNLSKQEQIERLNNIAKFLFNFDIFLLDENNSLCIHGGLPILNDGSSVNVDIKGKMTENTLDYIKQFNSLYHFLDYGVLATLTLGVSGEYQDYYIYYDMKKENKIKDTKRMDELITRISTSSHFIPTRYLNRYYLSSEEVGKELKNLLSTNNISRLIVGHDGNTIPEDWFCNIKSEYWEHLLGQDNTIIRLDRSYLKVEGTRGNFGYAIFKNGKFIEVGDSLNSLNKIL